MFQKILANCKSIYALLQWVTGRPDQVYVLVTLDDNQIRVVASTNLLTEGVRDLLQMSINQVNEQIVKEKINGLKRQLK